MITGIDHVDVLVHDLEATVEQYKAIFGTDKVRIGATTPGNGYRTAHIDFGDGNNIELMTPTDTTGPWYRHLEKNGDGIYLFALRVVDMEETVAGMKARGVRMPEPIRGLNVIHPRAAGGALILLIEGPSQ